jgi:hypothetical protein
MRRLLVPLLALAPLGALASVVMSLTMEELTARSPLVVHGTVHRVESGWDDERAKIWTWAEVVVRETFKGPRLATVLVKQPGGVVGEFGQEVSGVARFTPGEEVVLFLEPAPDEDKTWVPFSLSASKVTLVERFGGRVARRDLSGLSFAVPGKRGVIRPVDEQETLGLADQFLARIRAAAKGGAR